MFLLDLLKKGRITGKPPESNEITIVSANSSPAAEYDMVVDKVVYEDILVKYRAVEPASEAILRVLGAHHDITDPIWKMMLQHEQVSACYNKLCNEFHVDRLMGINNDYLEKETSEEFVIDDKADEEVTTNPLIDEEVSEVPASDVTSITPAKDIVANDNSKFTEEVVEDSVPEEDSVEDNSFFDTVLGKGDVENIVIPEVSEFTSMEESTGIMPDLLEDYIPEGIRPEEENLAEEQKESNTFCSDELLSRVDAICTDLRTVFSKFGIENVCNQTGQTFSEFVLRLAMVSPEISTTVRDSGWLTSTAIPATDDTVIAIMSSLRVEAERIINEYKGDKLMEVLGILLAPLTKILYEE